MWLVLHTYYPLPSISLLNPVVGHIAKLLGVPSQARQVKAGTHLVETIC